MLQNNWFRLLAVCTSNYGCTWEVWRAPKKLELLSAAPRADLQFSPALPTSRVHPELDARTLKHEPIVK